jgi:hypothetical protein
MDDARHAAKAAHAAFSAGAAMLPQWVVPGPPAQASSGGDHRPWWKKALSWTGHQVTGLASGTWDGVKGLGATGVMLYKLSVINQTFDPDSYNRATQQFDDSLAYAWDHPGKFAEQVVNWDDLSHGRIGHWAGNLVPDAALAFGTAGAGTVLSRGTRAVRDAEELEKAAEASHDVSQSVKAYKDLPSLPDHQKHHIYQDAAMRELDGYKYRDAPAINLRGGSHMPGSAHDLANHVQSEALVGGTVSDERAVAAQSLRAAGFDAHEVRAILAEADKYYRHHLGVTDQTPTRVPGNRYGLRTK